MSQVLKKVRELSKQILEEKIKEQIPSNKSRPLMWSRSNKEAPGAGSELEGEGGRQWGQKGNKGFTSLCMDLGFYSEQSKESSEKFLRKGVEWQGFHFIRTSLAAPLRVDGVGVCVCVCVS